MARGRKPKIQTVSTEVTTADYEKALKQLEQEQKLQLDDLYKDLAKVKYELNSALSRVGNIDSCETLGEAAFKAGRAYGPLDEANDKLEEILERLYNNNNLDHWDDVLEN
jgi:serine protease inhibitor